MLINNTERALTAKEFTDFESGFAKPLPTSFREHYLAHNGGFPEAEFVEGEKHLFSIDGFIPIKYGSLPIERLVREMETILAKELFVPFANDSGGNLFILSLDDQDYGNIYLLRTDTNEKIYVSKSFDDFIAGILESSEDPLD